MLCSVCRYKLKERLHYIISVLYFGVAKAQISARPKM